MATPPGQPPETAATPPAPRSSARAQRVEVKRKTLERYRDIVGDEAIEEVRDLARELRGLRVLELNATAFGGGVAELLASLVSLEQDLGIDAEWQTIAGDPQFFEITKRIHNGLQGMDVDLSQADRDAFLRHNEVNARAMETAADVVIVHDPQPVALRSLRPDLGGRWLWRCHIDSSQPDPETWSFLRPFVEAHDLAAFTMPAFVPPDLTAPTTMLVPAIDPLSSKNRALPSYLARETVEELGVDLSRPLLCQVSRFDPWKDPVGVVEVWRRARETFDELQLVLAGSMATDDPEGWRVYQEVEAQARGEPDCMLLTNQMGVAAHEVNALQSVADVVVQKSTREGFGLIVSETLWKGTPMVAGGVGGIPLQLEDGVSGYLADSVDGFAGHVVRLLGDPVHARALGAAGARHVRENFLLPRLLRDQLRVLSELVAG